MPYVFCYVPPKEVDEFKEVKLSRSAKNLRGFRFGRLIAIKPIMKDTSSAGNNVWLCECDCGKLHSAYRGSLTSGAVRSCGCLRDEITSKGPNDYVMNDDGTVSIFVEDKHGDIVASVVVDNPDFETVRKFRWCLAEGYVMSYGASLEDKHKKRLSRFIMFDDLKDNRCLTVDHINGDPLDNRRCNLRVCSQAQNTRNRRMKRLGYKGVSNRKGRYYAGIRYNGKDHHLGVYDTPEKAALAYNKAAVALFGEYACLNVID